MGEGRDEHLPNMARLVVQNQGACVVGAAWEGNSKLIEMIGAEIQAEHPDETIMTMAFTHSSSRTAGGRAISHCRHRYKDLHDVRAIVHEFSQIGSE